MGRLEPGAQGDLGEFVKYVECFGDLTLKCSEGLSHSSVLIQNLSGGISMPALFPKLYLFITSFPTVWGKSSWIRTSSLIWDLMM